MWTRHGGRLTRCLEDQILPPSKPNTVSSRRRRRAKNTVRSPASASNQVFSGPDLVGIIFTFMEEVEIVSVFSFLNRSSYKESLKAACWKDLNIYKWPGHMHFFYLLHLGRMRAQIRTVKLRLSETELYILQWLLQTCDCTCLEELDITFQANGDLNGDCLLGSYNWYHLADRRNVDAVIDVTGAYSTDVAILDYVASNSLLLEASSVGVGVSDEHPSYSTVMGLLVTQCPDIKTLKITCNDRFSNSGYLLLGSLGHLHTLRLRSLVAFELVKAHPNITDLALFGLISYGHLVIDIDLPKLKRLDVSDASKGLWFKRLDLPSSVLRSISSYAY